MKFEKPPLTIDDQVEKLLHRGMQGDKEVIRARLTSVNYYRLTGYWYPFRNADDTFMPGTTFEMVWRRYVFDRRLRLLVMDAIERLPVGRTPYSDTTSSRALSGALSKSSKNRRSSRQSSRQRTGGGTPALIKKAFSAESKYKISLIPHIYSPNNIPF